MYIAAVQGRRQRVRSLGEKVFTDPSARMGPLEIFTLNRRYWLSVVEWLDWFVNRQTMILPRKTKTYAPCIGSPLPLVGTTSASNPTFSPPNMSICLRWHLSNANWVAPTAVYVGTLLAFILWCSKEIIGSNSTLHDSRVQFCLWNSGQIRAYNLLRFLISNFRHVLCVVCFLLGNFPASKFYMPTFWNTLSVPSS